MIFKIISQNGVTGSSDLFTGFFLGIVGSVATLFFQYLLQRSQNAEIRKNLELQLQNQTVNLEKQLKSNEKNLKIQLYHNEQKASIETLYEIINEDISYKDLKEKIQKFLHSKKGYYLPSNIQEDYVKLFRTTGQNVTKIQESYGLREPEVSEEEIEHMLAEMRRDTPPWELMDEDIVDEYNRFREKAKEVLRKHMSE